MGEIDWAQILEDSRVTPGMRFNPDTGKKEEYSEIGRCFVRRDANGNQFCLGKFGDKCTNYPVEGRVLCARCLQINYAWHHASHSWSLPIPTLEQVYLRSGGRCEDCDSDELHLGMHHIRYTFTYVPREWECRHNHNPYSVRGRETIDDLDHLCWSCHQQRHISPIGGYVRDPQELIARWPRHYDERGRRRTPDRLPS